MKDSDINPTQVTEQKTDEKFAKIGIILAICSLLSCVLYFILAINFYYPIPLSDPDKGLIALIAYLGPLLCIPAIIISYKSRKKEKSSAFTGLLFGSLAAFFALLLMPIVLLLTFNNSESACRIHCNNNLKQIGLALYMYSNIYNETFPPYDGAKGLDLLRSESFLENPYVYKCPSTATSLLDLSKPLTEKNCDYIFFGGLSEASSVDIPLAMDKPDNHKGYRNVLFVDGHVKGYYNKEWKLYIKEYGLKIPYN